MGDLHEMAQKARGEAAPALAEALLRIYLADASGNNGLVRGEARLCRSHHTEARLALEAAGIDVPEWSRR